MASKGRKLAARVNALLVEGAKREMVFSHLKLQKLLFLSYVTHLQDGGEFLDYLPFQAWTYGPVVPDVYNYYKDRGYRGQDVIKKKMIHDSVYPVLENDKSISKTIERYGDIDASKLVDLTHQHGGAWHKAFSKGRNEPINHDEIKEEFADHE